MSGLAHIPVLVDQVVLSIRPAAGHIVVDGTFGRGGYTRAVLEAAPCRVIALDRDPAAIDAAAEVIIPGAVAGAGITPIEGRFGEMQALLASLGIDQVDAVMLDLGVSSPQIDDPARGFSFRFDGPLDMRMGRDGTTAHTIVNSLGETALADIVFRYGEERLSRRVARAIVMARREQPIDGTAALARIVRSAVPASKDGIDPATRTFQALRIYVNDEMGELERGLAAAERVLRSEGRLAVVSFHSLEDRVIKNFLRSRAGQAPRQSRHAPAGPAPVEPSFRLITAKPIVAGATELARNPRARSAKLRVAERTNAAPWTESLAA